MYPLLSITALEPAARWGTGSRNISNVTVPTIMQATPDFTSSTSSTMSGKEDGKDVFGLTIMVTMGVVVGLSIGVRLSDPQPPLTIARVAASRAMNTQKGFLYLMFSSHPRMLRRPPVGHATRDFIHFTTALVEQDAGAESGVMSIVADHRCRFVRRNSGHFLL